MKTNGSKLLTDRNPGLLRALAGQATQLIKKYRYSGEIFCVIILPKNYSAYLGSGSCGLGTQESDNQTQSSILGGGYE
jgi:hypothetical protein